MSHQVTEFLNWDLLRLAWEDLPRETKAFLCSYIRDVKSDDLESHVKHIANAGWDRVPYPCFGMLSFVDFDLSKSPVYDEIISNLTASSVMLDLGCGLGQEIRRLVYDGAPAENIVGLDKDERFIELGFDLFRDMATLDSTFLVDDFFKPSPKLAQLASQIRVINSGYFLHLWDWGGQVSVAKCMIGYLSLQEGDLITGVQFGREDAGLWKVPTLDYAIFLHNPASFASMWHQIGEETGTRWLVWSRSDREGTHEKLAAKGFRLRWYVRYEGRQSQPVPGENFSGNQADQERCKSIQLRENFRNE
ncbi:hypothetical protein BO85DRAFT_394180 [Aspergillus piperis CBS 112811]|uniref:Methyltransferase domain-containing protein n=1 Tax=Aspergillus piperis CBS 112811 TaxID=1448313 RepID=A0A8G1VNJ9_9EURO|nr:hypothetical protein BO85DRAFT_394180 [Aspergillus piperis CBS 112811]RAH58865.1 hypothetical protein BO85DRAFT_394180 [Aspergillus piperis CBS 112811]